MSLSKFQTMLSSAFNSVLSWIDSLGLSLGLSSLSTILVALTLISIVLAYTIRPSIGKSDEASRTIDHGTKDITKKR